MESNESMDFDFRPLTKGLGFHQSKVDQMQIPVAPIIAPKMNRSLASPTLPAPMKLQPQATSLPEFDLNGHQPYRPVQTQPTPQPSVQSIPKQTSEMASIPARLAAWGVDLVFIICSTVITVLAFIFLGKWQGIEIIGQFSASEFLFIYGILFAFVYLFYFSVLETHKSHSPGKKLFGLKLTCQDESDPTFFASFFRSLLSLAGISLFGLLSFWDVPGLITKTKIVKDQ